MVRIGLFSDVHGNLTALDAVARQLEQHQPLDAVIVAGDLLWGGARPAEVWNRLTASRWSLVRGNADETIASETVEDEFPIGSPYRHAAELLHAWTRERLDPEAPRALAALPFEHRLATPAGDPPGPWVSGQMFLGSRCGGRLRPKWKFGFCLVQIGIFHGP